MTLHQPPATFDLDATPWRRINLCTRRDIWCLVDLVDYELDIANNWNIGWHRNTPWKFYAKRNIGRERSTVYMHREIMIRIEPNVVLDDVHADHINGQSLDNRRCNLRWLSPAENRRHVTPRELIPSLASIVAELLAGVPAPGAVQGMPF